MKDEQCRNPNVNGAEAFEICGFYGGNVGTIESYAGGATTPQGRAILWGGSALFGSIRVERPVLSIHFQEDLPPLFDPIQFRGDRAPQLKTLNLSFFGLKRDPLVESVKKGRSAILNRSGDAITNKRPCAARWGDGDDRISTIQDQIHRISWS
jgi:hypothetical protein